MKTLLSAALVILSAMPAGATSMKEFDAKSRAQQSDLVVSFIVKMVSDIGKQNPTLGAKLKEFFVDKTKTIDVSEGLNNLYIETTALENAAEEGKADLSKIPIEGVIVKVVKDKFPPQQQVAPAPAESLSLDAININESEAKSMIQQCDVLADFIENHFVNTSVKDFQAMTSARQSARIARLVAIVCAQISRGNAKDGQYVTDFFSSDGIAKANTRFAELGNLTQQGKADPSKIKIKTVLYDVLLERIDKDQVANRQRFKEIQDNAIQLHDGRRAYIDGDAFRDDNGNLLQGADLQEARQKLQKRMNRDPQAQK